MNQMPASELREVADFFKALSDPTRLKIIKLLSEAGGALCVNAITHMLEVSQPAVSQHLRILKQAGIVQGKRYGIYVHYSLNRDALAQNKKRLEENLGAEFAAGL